MSIKQPLEGRESPFGQFSLKNRVVASRTSYATAVIFHYKKQNFGIPTNTKTPEERKNVEDAKIVSVERFVIEEEITSMRISKSVSQASGTFDLRLMPSQNWKQSIAPGDWVMLYIHSSHGLKDYFEKNQQDSKNLVMLGNVDRIARSLEKDQETDKVMNRYVVSGRGFGKVFEDTDMWFDPHSVQSDTLNKVALTTAGFQLVGSPDSMTKALIDIFLGPGADIPSLKARIPDFQNWQIPARLAQVFNKKSKPYPKFYDILTQEIDSNLPGYKVRQMLTLNSNGSLHDVMERSTNGLINQLIYEEVRDNNGNVFPTVILKPRPFNTPFFESHFGKYENEKKKAFAAIKNKYTTMQQLGRKNYVEISQAEVKYENIGRDDHSRFNLFYLSTSLNTENSLAYNANFNRKLGIANPLLAKASIQRHGLKRFEQTLEFCYTQAIDGASSPNIELYQGFMAQLYDMHFANHLYDAGTIETSGVLEAELGKALVVLPDSNKLTKGSKKKLPPKVYYIEGYEHNWSFPHAWTTTFTLSHGQFLVDSGDKIFIDAAGDDFGQPDSQIDLGYLAKTISEKQ